VSWTSFIKAVFRGEHKLAPTTWFMGIFTVIYTISPIDFFPDFIVPIIGYIDDLGMWGVFIALAAREKSRWEVAVAESSTVHAERIP
jgi:uncharacterized membrane protein YkvA (DUF1232 family)